jgi:aspartyl-tRNA(Asn)/glutamyl-tRNA(Gln) amidotransferase subunit C
MDRSELDITAELALMDLTDGERGQLESAVAQLLEYFSVMDSIDVSGLEPTTHALQEGNRLRPDALPDDGEAAQALADDILEQAPDLEDRFIAIPNVL